MRHQRRLHVQKTLVSPSFSAPARTQSAFAATRITALAHDVLTKDRHDRDAHISAPEGKPPRKVNSAWMVGFKLKGGPPLGQILSREYHQPARQFQR